MIGWKEGGDIKTKTEGSIFRLIDIYEISEYVDERLHIFRIEIFESIKQPLLYRSRVWLSTTYNVYPSQFNTNINGEDLHTLHSADCINTDITFNMHCADDLVNGNTYKSKEEFLRLVMGEVEKYIRVLNGTN